MQVLYQVVARRLKVLEKFLDLELTKTTKLKLIPFFCCKMDYIIYYIIYSLAPLADSFITCFNLPDRRGWQQVACV